MKNAPKRRFGGPVNRPGATPTPRPAHRHLFQELVARAGSAGLLLVSLSCGIAAAQGNGPTRLRQFIGEQVGGIEKLMVPANDSDLPQPRLPNGSPDPFFRTTEDSLFRKDLSQTAVNRI